MANLLSEYRSRHKIESLPVIHDGLLFLEMVGKPQAVVMTSLPCRSFATCNDCGKPGVIVEYFQSGIGGTFYLSHHRHVSPETDLLKDAQAMFGRQVTAFAAESPRDLETWLWTFCFPGYRGRLSTDLIGVMFQQAIKNPKAYNIYYMAYEAFVLSRKYLLFK